MNKGRRCTILVLQVHFREAIIVELPDGSTMVVTVLAQQSGKFKVGLAADESIKIHREKNCPEDVIVRAKAAGQLREV